MFKCKFCGRTSEIARSTYIHQGKCKLNPNGENIIPWNKGLKGVSVGWNKGLKGLQGTPHTEETKARLSEVAKERKLGGYVRGSGRGKKGWYKGFFCDSSWELAFLIYHLDHNILIQRCKEVRYYMWEGTTRKYYPDFVINNQVYEIKGYITKQWLAKHYYNKDIICLGKIELEPYLKYVIDTYGKDFIKLYEEDRGAGRRTVLKTVPI